MDGKIKTELKVIICEGMQCAHASGQEQAQWQIILNSVI